MLLLGRPERKDEQIVAAKAWKGIGRSLSQRKLAENDEDRSFHVTRRTVQSLSMWTNSPDSLYPPNRRLLFANVFGVTTKQQTAVALKKRMQTENGIASRYKYSFQLRLTPNPLPGIPAKDDTTEKCYQHVMTRL